MTSAPGSHRVRMEWARRTQAEYHSAVTAHNLVLWLMQMGAPADLLRDGLDVVSDELDHAELARTVFAHAGGQDVSAVERKGLGLSRQDQPLELDVFAANLHLFVLGETVAVRLFRGLRDNASVTPARAALDRILVDEARHRDFGWVLQEWLLTLPMADQMRSLAAIQLPGATRRIQEGYGGKEDSYPVPDGDITPEDRSWGLMSAAEYRNAVAETIEKDYRPRFQRLGITFPVSR